MGSAAGAGAAPAGDPPGAMGHPTIQVAVVGTGDPSAALGALAEDVGRRLAQVGASVVCGGLGGVMEAACRGAKEAGGLTVGILPGPERAAANRFVDVAVPTGLGEARNSLVARAGDAMVAVGGGYGTLAEMAFALGAGIPVIGLATWELTLDGRPVEAVIRAATGQEAVAIALGRARRTPGEIRGSGAGRSG